MSRGPSMTTALAARAARIAPLVVLAGAFLIALFIFMPAQPVIEPDSGSYLHFAPVRAALYPLFLNITGAQGALYFQPVIAVTAVLYLGLEMTALTGSVIAGVALMLAVACNPYIDVFPYEILTETLYISLFCVLLGLLARLARRPGSLLAAYASLVAGLMVTTRPVGWFTLPLMVLTALILQPRLKNGSRRAFFLASILPLLAATIVGAGYMAYWHDGKMMPFLDRLLYAKAALIEASPPRDESRAATYLDRNLAPARRLIAGAPNEATAAYLSIAYEGCVQYSCIAAAGIDPASPEARRAALTRITGNPAGFLALAWRNYRALWMAYKARYPGEPATINSYLAANQPLPFATEVNSFLMLPVTPFWPALLVQPVLAAIGVVISLLAFAGVTAAILQRPPCPLAVMALLAALAVQGDLALTAMTDIGIPRLMLATWPAIMTALLCLMCALVNWHRDRFQR